jgi:hypothetical protein
MAAPQTSQQKLPAGLAGVLNKSDEQRDSAYYSVASKREHSLLWYFCARPMLTSTPL